MSVSIKNIKFYLKKPGKARKSYSLVKYRLLSRTEKQYLSLTNIEVKLVKNINSLFQNKEISLAEAEARLKNYIKAQNSTLCNAITDSIMSDYNSKILSRFWVQKYEQKELVDSSSAKYDFQRAVKALSEIPLDSETNIIKSKLKSLKVNKLKRIYARLNEIRTFLGISDKLHTNKSEVQSISYITIKELYEILPHFENEDLKALVATLFASGMRLGEALAVTKTDFFGEYINVNKQLKTCGEIFPPKRNKIGKVIILKELKSYVERFIKIENKALLRTKAQSSLVNICSKVLKRHIHIHDLRHSHAIYLLSKGASLTLISLQLRNRIEVCQKYYSGFYHTDDTLKLLKSIAEK